MKPDGLEGLRIKTQQRDPTFFCPKHNTRSRGNRDVTLRGGTLYPDMDMLEEVVPWEDRAFFAYPQELY